MKVMTDISGQKFGYLTAISPCGKRGSRYVWNCACDCGNTKICDITRLRTGRITSCGCKSNKSSSFKHGEIHTRLYRIWADMRKRCNNPRNSRYERYGGRGIKVCKEWNEDFRPFYQWAMRNGYNDTLTIDRINNDSGYCPGNCRWVTWEEQASNKSTTIYVEHDGETKTLLEWCRIYGFSYELARQRCRNMKKRGERIALERIFYSGNLNETKVDQLTIDGEYIKTWNSMIEAGKCGYNSSGISKCCLGKSKTANGYRWRYSQK